jgi:uncharacterized protein DUF1573/peptidase C39-like protein
VSRSIGVSAAVLSCTLLGTPAAAAGLACGPSSVAWAAEQLGVSASPGGGEEGAEHSLADLKDLAQRVGLGASAWRMEWAELRALDTPAVLFLESGHFVAADPRDAPQDTGYLHVFDPDGRRLSWWDRRRVESEWKGVTLVMRPAPGAPKVAGPRVVFPTQHLDVGIRGTGDVVRVAFDLVNEGTQALVVSQGPSHCKCTVSDLPSGGIMPGMKSAAEVSMDLAGKRGPFEEAALVLTNDEQHPEAELWIRGTALQREPPLPASLPFGTVVQGDSAGGELLVKDPGDGSTRAVEVAVIQRNPAGLSVSSTARPIRETEWKPLGGIAGDYVVEIVARAPVPLPPGAFSGKLKVRIVGSGVREQILRFEGVIESHVTAAPAALVFSPGARDSATEKIVRLASRAGRAFDVRGLQVDPPGLVRVQEDRHDSSDVRVFRVRGEPGANTEAVRHGRIVFRLSPSGSLEVPVLIRAGGPIGQADSGHSPHSGGGRRD